MTMGNYTFEIDGITGEAVTDILTLYNSGAIPSDFDVATSGTILTITTDEFKDDHARLTVMDDSGVSHFVFQLGSGERHVIPIGAVDYVFIHMESGSDTLEITAGAIPTQIYTFVTHGGNQHDTIFAGGASFSGVSNVTLDGGSGDDVVIGSNTGDYIDGGTGENLIFAGSGDDYIDGRAGNDTIFGNDGNDSIFSHEGDDEVVGGNGNDLILAGNGNDSIAGEEGDDTLNGNGGHDLIIAGDGDDYVYGGSGNDTLFGGDGNDTMNGHGGADWGDGGAGMDRNIGGKIETALNFEIHS